MLCAIDSFMFESGGVDLSNIKRSFKFDFENAKLINAHDDWQATNKFSQEIALAGKLINKSNFALFDLEKIAQKKQPVTLSFENGKALTVLVLAIETDQSLFLKNGTFLKQDFEVKLGVIYA